MDVTDFGRYGTLSLLRRQENEGIVASYPIDDPEVTIGRDPTCNIRLYYPAVSAMHCKIVVDEENKVSFYITCIEDEILGEPRSTMSPVQDASCRSGSRSRISVPIKTCLQMHQFIALSPSRSLHWDGPYLFSKHSARTRERPTRTLGNCH